MARGGWLTKVIISRTVRLAALVLCCAVFSLAMIRDLVVPFDGIAYEGGDPRDSGQMVWNLWHVADSVLHAKNPFETKRLYYPVGANLAKHTLVSGFVPVTLLVQLLSGNHPLYPIYAFNILVWLSYTLLLLLSYLTLRALGFGVGVSIVPAIGFAFSDFYYLHATHLNLLAGFFMPLCALLIIRLCQAPSRIRAVGAAVALASAAYFTELFVSILLALAIFGLAALVSKNTRPALLRLLRTLGRRTLIASLLVFTGVLTPLLYEYVRCETLLPETLDYYRVSANLAGYFVPARHTTWLYGDLLRPLQEKVTTGFGGFEIFLGYPFLLCLVVGLLRPRARYHAGLLVAGLTFVILSLGPFLKVFNQDLPVPLPYTWLMRIPPFNQDRCPVRLATVAMFLFVPISAAGLSRILAWLERHFAKASSLAVWAAFLGWTVLETYSPVALTHGHFQIPAKELAQLGPGPVTYLPLVEKPCAQAVLQTLHGHPMTNGCLARHASKELIWAGDLDRAFREDFSRYLALLNQSGVKNILVVDEVAPDKLQALRSSGFNVVKVNR
jgi:hypothetical protein